MNPDASHTGIAARAALPAVIRNGLSEE
jgi:hypothetical protein